MLLPVQFDIYQQIKSTDNIIIETVTHKSQVLLLSTIVILATGFFGLFLSYRSLEILGAWEKAFATVYAGEFERPDPSYVIRRCDYKYEIFGAILGTIADIPLFAPEREGRDREWSHSRVKIGCPKMVRFQTKAGDEIDKKVPDQLAYVLERKAEVLYNPQNPEEFVINSFGDVWLVPIVVSLFILFQIVGLLCYMRYF